LALSPGDLKGPNGPEPIPFVKSGVTADFCCRLCGAVGLRPYYTLGRNDQFKYYRCPVCTLVNYDLSAGLDQQQYTKLTDPTDDQGRRKFDRDASWRFVERWLPGPGRFLDIGCGTGRLLYLAKQAGWEAQGLELSEAAASNATDAVGVPVTVGDFLQSEPIEGEQYDLVALCHVLEHLIDPLLALDKINTLLQPGGHALFEMPNIEGADKRLKRFLVNAGWHRRKYSDDFLPGHCNEYCRTSFEWLLKKTGFELVRWETYSKKALTNFLYTRVHVGNKARALVRKKEGVPRIELK